MVCIVGICVLSLFRLHDHKEWLDKFVFFCSATYSSSKKIIKIITKVSLIG